MMKKDLNYVKLLNVAKVEEPVYDHHHWLIRHDKENMKDHDAYQDRMKMIGNIMGMDQQKIEFRFRLAKKKHNRME